MALINAWIDWQQIKSNKRALNGWVNCTCRALGVIQDRTAIVGLVVQKTRKTLTERQFS
jgi:hypothetical protein